ncbi:MAG: hypothetical protein QM687_09305 [Ferruginibacter sp.]
MRTLLEQFYEAGDSSADVQIHLPLGRYVPEFTAVAARATFGSAAPLRTHLRAPRGESPQFWFATLMLNALLGVRFIWLAWCSVVALRWVFPPSTPPVAVVPDLPHLTIGAFDNLTGETVLDDDVAAMCTRRRGDPSLRGPDRRGAGLVLTGSVQEDGGQFSLQGDVVRPSTNASVWRSTIAEQLDGRTPRD